MKMYVKIIVQEVKKGFTPTPIFAKTPRVALRASQKQVWGFTPTPVLPSCFYAGIEVHNKSNRNSIFDFRRYPSKTHGITAKQVWGFTIVEVIVSIAIITAVSLVVFARYPTLVSQVDLDNLSQEVALAFRQAQVYSTAIRETEAGSGVFPPYGIYFNLGGGSPATSFVLFADVHPPPGPDGRYTNEASELIQTFTLGRGYYLGALRGCAGATCTSLNNAHITFTRPNFQANFITAPSGSFNRLEVDIYAPRDGIAPRTVSISRSGQIITE